MPGNKRVRTAELRRRISSEFRLAVLLAVNKIPAGKVASYKKIAEMAGYKDASRAVGNALNGNPFLITIPCHRVVCSDGSLGGFKKGAALKARLLKKEGIKFDGKDRVLKKFFIGS